MKVKLLREERLSDGGLVFMTKLGQKYSVTRGYNSLNEPPDLNQGLNKKQAEEIFIEYLRADVLELY